MVLDRMGSITGFKLRVSRVPTSRFYLLKKLETKVFVVRGAVPRISDDLFGFQSARISDDFVLVSCQPGFRHYLFSCWFPARI